MSQQQRDVVVLGASGFAGSELLRLLVCHPRLRLAAALSDRLAGQPVATLNPDLALLTSVCFTPASQWSWQEQAWQGQGSGPWTLVSALPHGETAPRLAPLLTAVRSQDVQVVDLSADLRLSDPLVWERYYHRPHPAPALLGEVVYGLPELHRQAIASARWVACPGCLATAAALTLLPAAGAGWQVLFAALDGKTGSSGAGRKPSETTHHPNRMNSFRAYRQLNHRHQPEIELSWQAAGGDDGTPISFVPHMAPMVRGIFMTTHLLLGRAVSQSEVVDRYRSFYAEAPFVRLVEGSPSVSEVWGSNRCDLSVTCQGKTVIVCAAIDNLVKGAAGQAIQNLNLMNGWEETAGLTTPPPRPV